MGHTRGIARDVLVEEVEHMLSFGQSPVSIADSLGIKPDSVARGLWRAGRSDLAVTFEQARTRRHQSCVDCGARTSDPRHPRCRACGCRQREANRANGRYAA